MAQMHDHRIRSTIPPPRGINGRLRTIHTDSAGNRLFAKHIDDGNGKKIIQFSGKNAEGRDLDIPSIKVMMKRWNRTRR